MRNSYRVGLMAALAMAGTIAAARAGWFSDEIPPPNAKPLSQILKMVEDRGYRSITEVEFEDGKWEIEFHPAGGKQSEIHVDPVTAVISEK